MKQIKVLHLPFFRLLSFFTLIFCVAFNGNAQIVADFTANQTSKCGSITPTFQDLSTATSGTINAWLWDFGDGTTATVQNPSHIYLTPGCYTVTLTVATATQTATVTKANYICVNSAPIINFPTITPAVGCAPQIFNLVGSTATSVPIASWVWEIGAGNIYTTQTVDAIVTDPGFESLVISVTDTNGCANDTMFVNALEVKPSPVAEFTANTVTACVPPLTTSFLSQSTLNGASMPAGTTYEWFFPGGVPSTSTAANPVNIEYAAAGNYDVTLIVTSPTGCKDTLIKQGYIGVGAVTVNITQLTPACIGKPIQLQASGAGTYVWDTNCDGTPNGGGAIRSFTFPTAGTFCVRVTGSNGVGCNDVDTIFLNVQPSPTAQFVADRTKDCKVPATFNFDASGSTGANAYTWSFGSGSTPASPFTTANALTSADYTTPGSKTVELVVSNAAGCTDTLRRTNYLQIQIPNAQFQTPGNITEFCVPANITFNNTSTSNDPIATYSWAVTPNVNITPDPSTVTTASPSFVFNDPGIYTVKLFITTLTGCTDSVVRTQYLKLGTHPSIDFTYSPSTECVKQPIDFVSVFQDPTWLYQWDFQYSPPAFNSSSTLPTPQYPYSDTGKFSVALIINNNGCRDTMVKDDIITIKGPKADFTVDPMIYCGSDAEFNITNNSVNAEIGNTTLTWYFDNSIFFTDFGNPNSQPVNPPAQLYGGPPAQIPIKLIITGTATGCTDSLTLNVIKGNPLADFTASPTSVCRDAPAAFNLNSQFSTSYEWDFGDGSTLTTVGNASHTYTQNGVYTVTMVASDVSECQDTIVKVNYITVKGPIAQFTTPDSVGCTPFTTSFQNNSILYPGTTQTSVSWNFGNPQSGVNNTANINTPSHTFSPSGGYNILMTLTDSDGCKDSLTKDAYILATFPDTRFKVNDSVTCAGKILTFTPTIPGANYVWDFGDGTGGTSSGPGVVTHTYTAAGQYTVTLAVTDSNGCADSRIKVNYIVIEDIVADFTGTPVTAPCPPLFTQFTDLSTGNISQWRWIFGDLTPVANIQNPGHIYTYAGNFDVTLIVTHPDGCKDTTTKNDFIILNGPIGALTVSPTSICPYDSVKFTLITDRTQTIIYEPYPGDVRFVQTDTTGVDTTVFYYTYTVPGAFNPVIQIQDPQGCSYNIPNIPQIKVWQPPIANFTLAPNAGCIPLAVSITNSSTPGPGSTGGAPITNWAWDFGNTNVSNQQNPPVQFYNTANTFPVSLIIRDQKGCRDTATQNVVAYSNPTAEFTASATLGCAPISINFTDLTAITIPTSWLWDFGDGNFSTQKDPSHTYTSNGTYTVSLVIADANGCADTLIKPNYIKLGLPVAQFVADTLVGCDPFTVCFSANQTVSDTSIASYFWNFGDGSTPFTTNADSVCHTFQNPGTFSVFLEVTDALGCQDDTTRNNYITVNTTTIPNPITTTSVTVENKGRVRADYEAYTPNDFRMYALMRFDPSIGSWIRVDSTFIKGKTDLYDNSPNLDCEAVSYCYMVLVQNDCRVFSKINLTQKHCTILATSQSLLDAIKINWKPYVGWSQVLKYDIYRSVSKTYNPAGMTLIGSVPGSVSTFTDNNTFCGDSLYYRVVAEELGGNQAISRSNVTGNQPKHNLPNKDVDVTYATVRNDLDIEVKWGEYLGYRPAGYILERSDGGFVWHPIETFLLTAPREYVDKEVMVDSISYTYRVIAFDSCGQFSQIGNVGKTILLRVTQAEDETPRLSWTAYTKWNGNVDYYEIEVKDSLNGWKLVDIVSGTTTSYLDTRTNLNQPYYCYRVRAHEVASTVVSLSNEDCALFSPEVYAPNAFTPNNDGNNDIFLVKGTNIDTYQMRIYDRWGRLVYESRDLTNGWDGFADGKAAPEGVYMYVINATGYKGKPIERKGSVTLIR